MFSILYGISCFKETKIQSVKGLPIRIWMDPLFLSISSQGLRMIDRY